MRLPEITKVITDYNRHPTQNMSNPENSELHRGLYLRYKSTRAFPIFTVHTKRIVKQIYLMGIIMIKK